ncbi:MAG TPA: DAK2 domain-containing protein, partial [Egicoccus sp.]
MAGGGGAPLAVAELPALLERMHAALAARRDAIDELNVFPVPDGDTGTNMTLTVRSGLEALLAAADATPELQAAAVIRGAVRGARGNSGVILSQVVRAVVEVVSSERVVDADLYARALDRARELAYEAVAEPVEGTILTVIAAAATAATAAAASGADL